MAVQASSPARAARDAERGRLGIAHPGDSWPTPPRLKGYEAAGFAHVQVRLPPAAVLCDREPLDAHARALREIVGLTGLALVLAGPVSPGAIAYAARAGAVLVICPAATIPESPAARRALRRVLGRAADDGVEIALENLAPAYPGAAGAYPSVAAVGELVHALELDHVRMCLDLGHAHITSALAGEVLAEAIEPVLDRVAFFHIHDNFGACTATRAGSIEPLRLDLHLPPGAGSLPWSSVAPLVAGHPAPVVLEVRSAGRPEPRTLAVLTREVLSLDPR